MLVNAFPIDYTHMLPESNAMVTSANALLSEAAIEACVLDQASPNERVLNFDFDTAVAMHPMFPIEPARLMQDRLKGEIGTGAPDEVKHFIGHIAQGEAHHAVLNAPDYSLVARFAKYNLAGIKNHLAMRRARVLETVWHNSKDAVAAQGSIDVSQDFMIWSRSTRLSATAATGEGIEAEIEQLSMDGTVTMNDREYAFSPSGIATRLSIFSDNPELPGQTYHISTVDPSCRIQIRDFPQFVLPGLENSSVYGIGLQGFTKIFTAISEQHKMQ